MAALLLFGTFFCCWWRACPWPSRSGLACLPSLIFEPRLSPMVLFNETFKAYNSFILLAVPFFLLTANLMGVGGITDRLVKLSRTDGGQHAGGAGADQRGAVGVLRRHLGSSTADAASQSKIFIDAQTKEGYDLSFSIAITAVSAVLAVIIPPSILMVVWGGVISTSIGALYLAGIIPGLLIAGAQMATVHVYAVRRKYPVYPRATLQGILRFDLGVAAGADDALHHRGRHPAGLVHADRVGRHRGDLRGRAVDLRVPRDGPQAPVHGAAGNRPAVGDRAVLRGHRLGLRLAARVLPDPAGAAGQRHRPGAWG
jgi:hypothetical protein